MKLKKSEQDVLEFMAERPETPHSPTEIGKEVGHKSSASASSWGSSVLGALVNFGLAEIVSKGRYKTTPSGKDAIDVLKQSKS